MITECRVINWVPRILTGIKVERKLCCCAALASWTPAADLSKISSLVGLKLDLVSVRSLSIEELERGLAFARNQSSYRNKKILVKANKSKP